MARWTRWKAAPDRPFELRATYRWATPNALDLETVVEHDPGVKGNIMFFGKKEGVERALDMFYGV